MGHAPEPGLKVVQADPFNAESPLGALAAPITPTEQFYVRSNFPVPALDVDSWRLQVSGLVERRGSFSLQDLQALPRTKLTTVLECAGNGRKLMAPVPPGTPWGLGAVSTGRFGGVRLRTVLESCGLDESVREIVFRGADGGPVEGGRTVAFERSLPPDTALHPDTLLAWEMNGAPLTPAHGFPVRLVVPGWYAVASVKWLAEITALDAPFTGHFQRERYVYRGHPSFADHTPVTRVQVRSLIATPADGAHITGSCTVRGAAWSGEGGITRVQLSDDDGATWHDAVLRQPAAAHELALFAYEWRPARTGAVVLMARAEDSSGAVQPLDPVWNELGYANNVVHRVRVNVRAR
jgi:DMSO/TMAO reductase YedYZ molybdopterin-dependent catalytic subunit